MAKKTQKKDTNSLFLHTLLLGFIFVASASLVFYSNAKNVSRQQSGSASNLLSKVKGYKTYTPIPVLNPESSFPIISAQGALAVDLDSRIPLYEKNPDSAYLPASTVKIITALVAMDYYQPDHVLMVNDVSVVGQKMGLYLGEEIVFQNLLEGLLIHSANDAAEVIASEYPGGRSAFIAAMNEKAAKLNLENTLYKNPTGLDGGGQLTTARDLMRIAEQAMSVSGFADIVKQEDKYVESFDGGVAHKLTTTNQLLGKVDGVLGVKTGWTENARENLVTYIERDDKRIMIAVLSSQDRFEETTQLIDWIFENYTWEDVSIVSF